VCRPCSFGTRAGNALKRDLELDVQEGDVHGLLANGFEDHFLLSQVEGAVIDEGFGVV
jgi:hypothetical protein